MDGGSVPALDFWGDSWNYSNKVMDLQAWFLTVANQRLRRSAGIVISGNGTRVVFEHLTTVAALRFPQELVSHAVSLLHHPDPAVVDFLKDEMCYFVCEAARRAALRGSCLMLFAEVRVDQPVPENIDGQEVRVSWPMETERYSRGGESRETACPICLDDFKEGVGVGRMPCSHMFHVRCIARWFWRSHLCPLCRSPCWELEDQTETAPTPADHHAS